jgi:hypothetical protein
VIISKTLSYSRTNGIIIDSVNGGMPSISPITIRKLSVETIVWLSNHSTCPTIACGGKKKTWRLWNRGRRLRIVSSLGVREIPSSYAHWVMRWW